MSLISRIQEQSNSITSSELDSGDEIVAFSRRSYNSKTQIYNKTSRPTPVQEFRQSLENEKNIRKLMSRLDTLDTSQGVGNEKIDSVLEKNYKLQIQTLLEEVNKLKLEKKLMEKRSEKDSRSYLRSRAGSDFFIDDSNWKQTLDIKDSTIKELEFQISQLKSENNVMKTRLEGQTQQINELFQRLADAESLKEALEEKNEEIAYLKKSLEDEETKREQIVQEFSNMKNENITLKFQNNSITQLPTGANSILNVPSPWLSKDQSFISTGDKLNLIKGTSDTRFGMSGGFNLSEMNESPILMPENRRLSSITSRASNTSNASNEEVPKSSKSEFSRIQRMSAQVLSDYERGIRKKSKASLDRIIEVNRIKSFFIEEQNKKLLSILNQGKEKESFEE